MKWLKLLLSWIQTQKLSGIWNWLKKWAGELWPWVLGVTLSVLFLTVAKTCADMQDVKIHAEQIKLQKQDIKHAEYSEAEILKGLKQLKDNEVLIIQRNRNEKAKIAHIPIDSLQHWADSLYGCPPGEDALW